MTNINNNVVDNNDFIKNALYKQFKEDFADEVKECLLNQKPLWIGDLGYLVSEVKRQGTKSGKVIDNVKLKFKPSKEFKKEINKVILNKQL